MTTSETRAAQNEARAANSETRPANSDTGGAPGDGGTPATGRERATPRMDMRWLDPATHPAVARPPGRRRGRPGYDLDGVLSAAVRLFNERGYEATSMGDLAERLGITKSSIYHHVSSKEQLLRMAVGHALDGLFEVADEVRELDASATERLETLIRRSVLVLADRLEFVTLLLRVRGNTAVETEALLRRKVFDARVTELVTLAKAEGGIRADVDSATAGRLLFGMVNSLTEWYRPDRGGAEALADVITAIAFDGLRTREGDAEPGAPGIRAMTGAAPDREPRARVRVT